MYECHVISYIKIY